MKIEKINKLNPNYHIKSIWDDSFRTYGKIIKEDVQEAIDYVNKCVLPPKNGTLYKPSIKILEQLYSIKKLSKKVYGGLSVIAGCVCGYNQVLNGIEYHQGSETIVAINDFILVVGHIWDMKNNIYDSSLCEMFYVPAQTIIECYSTTLHYTPIQVDDKGIKTICLLLAGTGEALEKKESILKKKNKWFIAHKDNIEKIENGDYPGLKGKLVYIKH